MSDRQDPGRIVADLRLEGGRIAEARVRSTRPFGVVRVFAGMPAASVPTEAGRLFALCGASHRAAARHAIAAALGDEVGEAERRDKGRALALERIGEHLRAVVTGLADLARPSEPELAAIRRVLGVASGRAPADALSADLARLGLGGSPAPGSWRERLEAALADVETASCTVDPLGPAADDAVVGRLAANREAFAAAPALPGRTPETGPLARRALLTGRTRFPVADHLAARLDEIADAALVLDGGAAAPSVASRRTGEGTGFAAVESARGRLHHWVRATKEGTVAAYAILAPTEWNFASDGPFVRLLVGRSAGSPEAAMRIAARVAALVSPCVAFEVRIAETAHA